MKTFLWVLLAGVVVSTPAFAHHGNASFDAGKKLELKGTVTEWDWANPHCWLKFDVKDKSGKVVNWVVETSNSADMVERGWSKRTFKAGDQVTVTLSPAANVRLLQPRSTMSAELLVSTTQLTTLPLWSLTSNFSQQWGLAQSHSVTVPVSSSLLPASKEALP